MGNSLPEFSPADNPAANEPSLMTRTLTFLYLPFYNFWLLLYPANLSYAYSTTNIPLVKGLFSLETFLSFALYAFLFVCGLFYLTFLRTYLNKEHKDDVKYGEQKAAPFQTHKKMTKHRVPSIKSNIQLEDTKNTLNVMVFGFALLILPFLPATNLFFYVGFIVAERILYIPSIGYCLLVVNGIHILMKKYIDQRQKIVGAVTIVLVLFAVKTFNRNYAWENEETLYRYIYFVVVI